MLEVHQAEHLLLKAQHLYFQRSNIKSSNNFRDTHMEYPFPQLSNFPNVPKKYLGRDGSFTAMAHTSNTLLHKKGVWISLAVFALLVWMINPLSKESNQYDRIPFARETPEKYQNPSLPLKDHRLKAF